MADALTPAQQALLALARCALGTPMRATEGREILRQMSEMEATIKALKAAAVTDETVERAARAMERACFPQWADDVFEIWWSSSVAFTKQQASWGHFTGTEKDKRLWEARIALNAAA